MRIRPVTSLAAIVALGIIVAVPSASFAGYWMVGSDGGVFTFGNAQFFGSLGGQNLAAPIVGMEGNASFLGNNPPLNPGATVAGFQSTPDGTGYWMASTDGGVYTFGTAQFFGSNPPLNQGAKIVGMEATSDGKGYWLASSDGGVFTFGDAKFFGSHPGPLNKPIVGIEATPNDQGYWLVAADGGLFNYGNAPFQGSLGGQPLNAPIVGMENTPTLGSGPPTPEPASLILCLLGAAGLSWRGIRKASGFR
jgi:hypothetical protein